MEDDSRLQLTDAVSIPMDEIEFTAIRAQGPGGQHVNKASTAVQLRFDIRSSDAFDAEMQSRLLAIRDRRISADGVVVIKAQRFRSREKNRQDAVKRLAALLESGLRTQKRRKPTRPTKAQVEKRLEEKARRARLKSLRRRPDD